MSRSATPEEIRRVRQALGEDQLAFGARFFVTRRTVIRWEKTGHIFRRWSGWLRGDGKSESEIWLDAVENASMQRATAISARKPKAARRRQSAKKAVAVKRRRGSAARRRPVVKGKTARARR